VGMVEQSMSGMYLDDFVAGRVYRSSARKRVTTEEIKKFAAEYDPQPFHLDEEAGKKSFFGEFVASGWHTAAMTMRLMVDSEFKAANGLIGAGLEELKWPRPVRPGDELRIETEVLEIRESKSRPDIGFVKFRMTTLNQKDEAVQTGICNLVVPRRKA
jgi:acyl dehydratase